MGSIWILLIKTAFPYFMKIARDADEHKFNERHQETLDIVLAEFPNTHNFVSLAAGKGQLFVNDLSNLSFSLRNFYQLRSFLGLEIISRILPLQINKDLKKEKALSLNYLGDLESHIGPDK